MSNTQRSKKTDGLQNDLLLRALQRQRVPRTPLWLMRQAGRYLPEYNALRTKAGSFLNLAHNPEWAAEITLQPLERFALDAAIIFSDILVIPDAMGLGLHFVEGEGPRFARPIRTEADVLALRGALDLDKLRFLFDAIALTRRTLAGRVPLIGFAGSPWTLACYMIEGGASSDFAQIKHMLYTRPELLSLLLRQLAEHVADCLAAQIAAGAQAVMVFDTWGGVLSHEAFRRLDWASLRVLLARLRPVSLKQNVPSIVFVKGGGAWLEDIAALGYDAVGLDWQTPLGKARKRIGSKVALQGNLDPQILLAGEGAIEYQAQQIIEEFGTNRGHIFNLGHGISQHTPPEAITTLVAAVKEHSERVLGGKAQVRSGD